MILEKILHFLKNKKIIYPVLIGLFFVLFFLNNINWLSLDKSIPTGDHGGHIAYSYQYHSALKSGDLKFFFLYTQEKYPPLTYHVSTLFYLVCGPGVDAAVISQFPFWLILIFSVYFLGARLWNEDTGLLAGIACLSLPYMTYMSQRYVLDLPCAAMVGLSLLCLFYSDAFERPAWTIAFFISFALAMLTKWASVFFIAAPFLYYLGCFIRKTHGDRKLFRTTFLSLLIIMGAIGGISAFNFFHLRKFIDQGGNIVYLYLVEIAIMLILLSVPSYLPIKEKPQKRLVQGFILFFIIIWHFYGVTIGNLAEYFSEVWFGAAAEGDVADKWMLYREFVFNFQGMARIVMLTIGLVWFIFDPEKTRGRYILIAGFIASVMILHFIPDKELRYQVPLIVFTSILTTFWITRIKWKILKISLILLFLFMSLLGAAGWRMPGYKSFCGSSLNYIVFRWNLFPDPPDTSDWKFREIVDRLCLHTRGKNSIVLVVMENVPPPVISTQFLWPFYTRNSKENLHWLLEIDGKSTREIPPGKRAFDFYMTPPREDQKNPLYDHLLVFYFRKKERHMKTILGYKDLLKEKGLNWSNEKIEIIQLPQGIVLHVIDTKIEPGISETKLNR